MKKPITRYVNFRGSQGVETVDEFSQEKGQNLREFFKYLREMVSEYRLAGLDVYSSTRCTKEWKNR